MNLRADGGTTYMWTTRPTLWPFGFGLTYTTFSYKWEGTSGSAIRVQIPSTVTAKPLATHVITVTNTGRVISDCVVSVDLLQISPPHQHD